MRGAQWDEVHRRWEVWDEATEEWTMVGDAGDGVAIAERTRCRRCSRGTSCTPTSSRPPTTSVADVERASPVGPAPRGAQWNEITDRWERWDEATDAWVEATGADDPRADQARGHLGVPLAGGVDHRVDELELVGRRQP